MTETTYARQQHETRVFHYSQIVAGEGTPDRISNVQSAMYADIWTTLVEAFEGGGEFYVKWERVEVSPSHSVPMASELHMHITIAPLHELKEVKTESHATLSA